MGRRGGTGVVGKKWRKHETAALSSNEKVESVFTSPVVWLLVAKYNSLWCTSLKAYLVCAKNLPPCQKMARSNPPIEMFQLMV